MEAPLKLGSVILNWDVNGTLTFADSTKSINELISDVAGTIFYQWDSAHPIMSYKNYIQRVKLPGNKYDEKVKRKQEEEIGRFLDFLRESKHPLFKEASDLYTKLADKYLSKERERAVFTPFRSAIKLIEQFRKVSSTTIILRTFGPDGPEVAKELKIARKADFTPDGVKFEGEEGVTTGKAVLKGLMASDLVGQDQVEPWLQAHQAAYKGKLIYCVKEGKFEGKTVVSIVFDDNLKKIPKEEKTIKASEPNIALPVDVFNRPLSWTDPGIIGIRVNPVKAALQENYFIRKVNKQLQARHIQPLED